jgi:formamidopyrimidine-DNA glycosylase
VPELPEVESVRRQLAPALTGRVIDEVWWDDHPQQRFSDVADAAGRRIEDVTRRGKYLLLPLTSELVAGDTAELVLHLGMTGSFRFSPTPDHPELDHVRAWFALDDGTYLLFDDPRRFGRVSVVPTGDHATIPTLAALGPEPLGEDFTVAGFADALQRTSATVKAVLLGQRAVAGVGNIYADESLWRARIHPRSRRVGRGRAARLHAAVVEVIRGAVEREGTTFRDYQMVNGQSGRNADFLDVYGRGGLPCPRCGTALRHTVVAQRGTTYCPRCQRV